MAEDTVLETDVFNHEPGHAAKHNSVNTQVNWLTQFVGPDGGLSASYGLNGRSDEPTGGEATWLSNRVVDLHAPAGIADRRILLGDGSTDAQEPSVFFADGQWWMTYTTYGLSSPGIAIASADSPAGPWTDHGRILGAGAGTGTPVAGDVFHSNVYIDVAGNTAHIFFTNEACTTLYRAAATMTAGALTTWNTSATTWALPSGSTYWGNTCVIKEGSNFTMFFETFRSGAWLIGYGTLGSSLSGSLTVTDAELTDLKLTNDGSTCNPTVYVEDGQYVMYYHAALYGSLPSDIYRATSPDKVTWTIDNDAQPVIPRLATNEVDQVADVSLAQTADGDWWAIYTAFDNPQGKAYVNGVPLLPTLRRLNSTSGEYERVGTVGEAKRIDGPQHKALSANATTTSTSLTDLGLQVDFHATTSRALVTVSMACCNLDGDASQFVAVLCPNGTPQTKYFFQTTYSASGGVRVAGHNTVLFTGLTPGTTHQFVVRWKVSSGTALCRPATLGEAEHASITVIDAGQPMGPYND